MKRVNAHCLGSVLSILLFLLSSTVFAQTQAPAPTGLMVSGTTDTSISLTWTAPADDGNGAISGYNVYSCEEGETACTPVWLAWVDGGATTWYTHSGLTTGATYRYAVGSSRGAGTESAWSNQVTAAAEAPPQAPAPTGLTVSGTTATTISLTWTAPADDANGALLGYNVYSCEEGETACTPVWLAWVGGGATTWYTHSGLTTGTTYRYAVGSNRGAGTNSAWSDQVTATTEAPPQAPALTGTAGDVVVEDTPGQLANDPLAQPDYLWHYGSVAPVFTIDDNAGFGTLSAGSIVTLSGAMTLQGNNHRDYWDDRLVLAVGTGNGPASANHPHANSFGYAGGNNKVYALAVSVCPVGSSGGDGNRPPLKVIDALSRRDVTSASTRRSPTLVWELSITLANTWKDYSTGDNSEQDNGRGIERHEHSYTLKLDLDYDEAFETTLTGTFKTYQAESIGISFAVQQAEARYFKSDPDNSSGPDILDDDVDTWGAAARAVNSWLLFTGSATAAAADLYPGNPVQTSLSYDTSTASHKISPMLFGTNIEHFDTEDRYWDDYAENGELIRLIKERPVSWIRFPGGEPTSFYHFDSESKKMTTTANWGFDEWDTSKSEAERALAADGEYMDFKEFAKVVEHTGATPFIGINLESAYYFRALGVDDKLLDPANAAEIQRLLEGGSALCGMQEIQDVDAAKTDFSANYSSGNIQDGLDQARAVALYMNELGLDVRHWYLDNESDLETYNAELCNTFKMTDRHYARMARDYIGVIDQATGRTNNKYILNWNNLNFMRDIGWDRILDDAGSLVDYIDLHTYWWVHGGSWSLNLASLPYMSFPSFGVSSWDIWKEQLPMRWENFDDDSTNFVTGNATNVYMSPAPTGPVSLADYVGLVREALDNDGHTHIKIMLSEWGVAPRGHWRLNPTYYQISLMLAEYFMQMLSSDAIDAAASWPFSSLGGPFLDNRHNVLHKPDGANEVIASYTLQKLFKPFINANFLPVTSGEDGVIAIGAYKSDTPSLHLAIMNKTGQERTLQVPVGDTFNTVKIRRMQPGDDPGEYDGTYGSASPVFETIAAMDIPERAAGSSAAREVSVAMQPWSLAWVALSHRLPQVAGFTAGAGTNSGEIQLSWDAVSGATGYEVRYRAAQQGTNLSDPIIVSGGSAISYTLTGLTGGQNYIVRVRAISSGADLSSDAVISGVAATAGSSVALAAPVARVTPGAGQITLDWDPVPGATGYQVRYREAVQGTVLSDYIDVAATQYTLTGVQGTYVVRVRAVSNTEFSSEFITDSAQTN